MSIGKRVLKGSIAGVLLGLGSGLSLGLIFLLIELSNDWEIHPSDWSLLLSVMLLPTTIGAYIGLVAGLASSIFDNGLPLLTNVAIVSIAAILSMLVTQPPLKSDGFLIVPIAGALGGGLGGGLIVLIAGFVRQFVRDDVE